MAKKNKRRRSERTIVKGRSVVAKYSATETQELLRIIVAAVAIAGGLYLLAALLSAPVAYSLGASKIPGGFGGNLAGQFGGATARGLVWLLGGAAILFPFFLLYWGIGVIRRKERSELLKQGACSMLALLSLALVTAAAFSIMPISGASQAGGVLGQGGYRLLVSPFGQLGALIIPLVALIVTLAFVVDYRLLGNWGNRALKWCGQVLLSGAKHAYSFLRRFIVWGSSKVVALARWGWGLVRERSSRQKAPELETDIDLASIREYNEVATATGRVEEAPAPMQNLDATPRSAATTNVPATTDKLTVYTSEDWVPPVDLFEKIEHPIGADQDAAALQQTGELLIAKLAEFKIKAKLAGWTSGPTVVCFHVVPASGVKLNRIVALEEDLAIGLRQKSVRVAAVPESGAVGIEMAHPTPRMVGFREMYESPAFADNRMALPILLGLDLQGKPVVSDLAKMPHLLVAGATGSGKSVALNVLLTSLCAKHPPEDLRLILVDPKRVEMAPYQDLPHLRHPVIYDAEEVSLALKWAVAEMERRYDLLKEVRARNLFEYEEKRLAWEPPEGEEAGVAEPPEKLPFLVIVIDELADLMMIAGAEIESLLVRIAQKARAVGIHLVLATQRPTVQVITGLIKANVPSRMAFRVVQKNDSRTILDQNGADALLGNGDMLFLPPGQGDVIRIQGAFISTAGTEALVQWCVDQRPNSSFDDETDIVELARQAEADAEGGVGGPGRGDKDLDPLFDEALEVCVAAGGGSTSLLQRRLSIGYGRAARIIDQLVDAGYLGDSRGSRPRPLLNTH